MQAICWLTLHFVALFITFLRFWHWIIAYLSLSLRVNDFVEHNPAWAGMVNILYFSSMMYAIKRVVTLPLLLLPSVLMADAGAGERSVFNSVEYSVSLQGTASAGDYTPLWLNANRHGLSSLDNGNGYLRAALVRPLAADSARKWGLGYGLDLVGAVNFNSAFIVQQAFVEARWLHGVLTVGSKEYPMELKNNRLSSGSQTLGVNARPVPQVRLALPDYWPVPLTRGWVSLKGHIAYGMTTDGNWQENFSGGKNKYTTNTFYHSKAGYLKIGPEGRHVSLELGLEMAAQFGGTSYIPTGDGQMRKVENKQDFSSFVNAFIPGGSDVVETTYQNSEGNQLGSWLARLNFDYAGWGISVYADHFFEDHSQMFLLDYDGYGSGNEWNAKKDNRYLLYSLKDMMLGAELRLKKCKWVDAVVLEYLYSKYQSGPIYHDHNSNIPDHIGGVDDYYNHYIYSGWQHWGQVIGNPLYLSPAYNADGAIEVKNNRTVAWHLGVGGAPADGLRYRVLASYQKGYGRYLEPYPDPEDNFSLLLEADYSFPESHKLAGWGVRGGFGIDAGTLRGNNYGLQLTVMRTGVLNFDKKKSR